MSQLSEREKSSKKKALLEAIQKLKLESVPGKNQVTQAKVCNLANECLDSHNWSCPISVQTIKRDDSNSFAYNARTEIINFKQELKKFKETTELQILTKMKLNDKKYDALLTQFVKILDNEIEYKKEISQLELVIDRKDREIISLRKSLSKRN